jgi:hypothetical protein
MHRPKMICLQEERKPAHPIQYLSGARIADRELVQKTLMLVYVLVGMIAQRPSGARVARMEVQGIEFMIAHNRPRPSIVNQLAHCRKHRAIVPAAVDEVAKEYDLPIWIGVLPASDRSAPPELVQGEVKFRGLAVHIWNDVYNTHIGPICKPVLAQELLRQGNSMIATLLRGVNISAAATYNQKRGMLRLNKQGLSCEPTLEEHVPLSDGLTAPIRDGKVGFFWVVPDRSGEDTVLGEALDLMKAEHYGESLTHPEGHYDFWEAMQIKGPAFLRAGGLSAALLATEYEDWPRGRVVFSLKTQRFTLLADRRLRTLARISAIRTFFNLPDGTFDIRSDGHYVPVQTSRSV